MSAKAKQFPNVTLLQWCQLLDLIERPRSSKEIRNWLVVRNLIKKGYAECRGDKVFHTSKGLQFTEQERLEETKTEKS